MIDPTSRFWKVGDALSQLINVAFFPDHTNTTANESISGRSFRCGWVRLERIVNLLFFFDKDHCRNAYRRDIQRAEKILAADRAHDLFKRN